MVLDDLSYLNSVVDAPSSLSQSPPPSNTSTNSLQPLLDALAVSSISEEDLNALDDSSVTALLQKIDQADHVSAEMEKRLDNLLGDLDGLLESLEGETSAGEKLLPNGSEPTLDEGTSPKS